MTAGPTRVAAVDCGTNTLRLLVADLDPATGTLTELVREMEVVRLGEGVDRTGRLSDEALARTFTVVEQYAATVADHQVAAVRFCATSASRDADNADEFVAGVRARLGVDPEVVTGLDEAALSFDGAVRDLAGLDVRPPFLVLDVGGGSTELVLGDAHGSVDAAHSLDIGSVRLTERSMPSDPPTDTEVAEAAAWVDAELDRLADHGVEVARARTLVGVAGTATTLAAMALDLPSFDRELIHHSRPSAESVHACTGRLLRMPVAEIRELPFMHPGRADVIAAGALILDRVLRRTGLSVMVTSESDILDGIAWSLA